MKIAILSNVNLDMLVQSIGKEHDVFPAEGYGQWITYALKCDKALVAFNPKLILLLLDGNALLEVCGSLEKAEDELRKSVYYAKRLAENYSQSTVAVSTIDIPKLRVTPADDSGLELTLESIWNAELSKLSDSMRNIIRFDLKGLIENEGRRQFYSEKMWYMGSIPYSIKGIAALQMEISAFISRWNITRKKVLVLDLDNTLWGGIIGEDGPEGIVLGESLLGGAYRDAQRRIKEISDTGILLAVVSKNNPEDVEPVFKQNSHMVLQWDDFVSIICNWKPKYENIRDLAKTLNLGLESFVFLDDNPVEREAVRINLPEVTIADFPKDIARLPKTVSDIYEKFFFCWKRTAEDRARKEQYKQEVQRKQNMDTALTFEEYLKSLQIKIVLGKVTDEQMLRAVQLLNKTNQFNTNTVRMDSQEFEQYVVAPQNRVFVAEVSDKYGNNGLVAELLLHLDGERAYVDNFLMSCRVMGRQIEDAIICAVKNTLASEGIKQLNASYVKTAKNKPVEQLWDNLGFTVLQNSEDVKRYAAELNTHSETLLEVDWR